MNSRRIAACAMAAALLAGAGCGRGATTATETGTGTEPTASAERFCTIAQELDTAGNEVFAELENDPDASQEDYAAAERRFYREHAGEIDDLIAAAPTEIRESVEVATAAGRERAGIEVDQPASDKQAEQADREISAWEEENCGGVIGEAEE